MKLLTKSPNHGQGEISFSIQNFVNPIDPPNRWNKILRSKPILFHQKTKVFNRCVLCLDGKYSFLIFSYKSSHSIEPHRIVRSRGRIQVN